MTSARKRATANRLTSASRCKAVAGQRMRMTALFIRMIRTGAAPNWNAERRLAVAAEEERAAQLGRSRRALGRRQAVAQDGSSVKLQEVRALHLVVFDWPSAREAAKRRTVNSHAAFAVNAQGIPLRPAPGAAPQKGIGAAGLARRERIGHEQDGPQEAACPRYSQIARGN